MNPNFPSVGRSERFTLLIGGVGSRIYASGSGAHPGAPSSPGIVCSDSFRCCAQCTKPVPKTGSPTCKIRRFGVEILEGVEDFLGPGGFKGFLFSPRIPGEMMQFDSYFSNGLKPPTSFL